MASGLGILASMLAGGGKGVQDNAQRSMDEKAKLAEEQRKEAGILARMQEQRDYEESQYDKKREDQLTDAKANRKHEIDLANMKNQSASSNASKNSQLAGRVRGFEDYVKTSFKALDELEKEIAMNGDGPTNAQKARMVNIVKRLDDLVENNRELEQYSSVYAPIYNQTKSMLEQLRPKQASTPESSAAVDNGAVIPAKQDVGSNSIAQSNQSGMSNQNQAYFERSPEWMRSLMSGMPNLKAPAGESNSTADIEMMRQSGSVRPF